MSSARLRSPSIRYACATSSGRCASKTSRSAVVMSMRPNGLARCDRGPSSAGRRAGRMALLEIEERNRQGREKDERIDDEQHAEPGISARQMRDAGRYQRDAEAEVGELFDLERDARYRQREHAQYLRRCELDLEIARQAEMRKCAFGAVWEREMVVEDEVEDAEHHHGEDDACRRALDDRFSFGQRVSRCGHEVLHQGDQTDRVFVTWRSNVPITVERRC